METRLAILGAGGHGRVVADAAAASVWAEIVFYDDSFPDKQANLHWPIVGTSDQLMFDFAGFGGVIVAIGDNRVRLQHTRSLLQAGAPVVSIIHPSAIISPYARVARGCMISAGAIVNPGAIIELACIVNTAAVVEHDCRLDEGVHLCPNAVLGGNCQVGECSWIGIGSATRQDIRIGADVLVGAGAVVVTPLADGVRVVGNPASILGREK